MSAEHNVDSLKLGAKFASEAVFPGGSNLLKGDLKQGGIHAGLGFLAKGFFGVPGLLLVSANSFSKAVTGSHLHEHLGLHEEADASDGDG